MYTKMYDLIKNYVHHGKEHMSKDVGDGYISAENHDACATPDI